MPPSPCEEKPAWIRKIIPPRVQTLFVRQPEIQIHSELLPEEFLARFLARTDRRLSAYDSMEGRVSDNRIRLRWIHGTKQELSPVVFRGVVEPAEQGSTIRGHMSFPRIGHAFLILWCCAIGLFSLFFIWTVIAPLGGWALLWILNGMMAFEDNLYPGRQERLTVFLKETAGGH